MSFWFSDLRFCVIKWKEVREIEKKKYRSLSQNRKLNANKSYCNKRKFFAENIAVLLKEPITG